MTRNCKPRPLHHRFQTFRYEVIRNTAAAAAVTFMSGILSYPQVTSQMLRIRNLTKIWTGQTWATDNYITWLKSSATGLGILFAVLSQSISKGRDRL